MGGVNHCRSHCHPAKYRYSKASVKCGPVIGWNGGIFTRASPSNFPGCEGISSQSQGRISLCASNHEILMHGMIDSGWPLPASELEELGLSAPVRVFALSVRVPQYTQASNCGKGPHFRKIFCGISYTTYVWCHFIDCLDCDCLCPNKARAEISNFAAFQAVSIWTDGQLVTCLRYQYSDLPASLF